jgi:tRNA threonylcarbamoyl adenosine modification protein YeaZ
MTALPLLLALHSCSNSFGMALLDPEQPGAGPLVQVHPDGRGLSNSLISRVQALLPPERWPQLQGLAVATGPGGFTGTRLSVVMARTMAQQLACPLLGVSSYSLMAPRLELQLPQSMQGQPFWVTQELPRRGVVGGEYQISAGQVHELSLPTLLPQGSFPQPAVEVQLDVAADVERLLQLLQRSHGAGAAMPWAEVLPIYPTSPVGQV